MNRTENTEHKQEKIKQEEFYDSYADDYDDVELWALGGRENEYRQRFMLRRATVMARYGHLSPNSDILEIGCGTGNYTKFWVGLSGKTYALDLSRQMLRKAATKISSPSLTFIEGDAESLPFESSSFDAVLSVNVAEHLDIPLALDEMKRVCKNKGKIVLSIPNSNTIVYKLLLLNKRLAGWMLNAGAFSTPQYEGEAIHNVPLQRRFFVCFGEHGIQAEGKHFMGFIGRGLAQKVPAPRLLELLERFIEKVPIVKSWAGIVIVWGSVSK